MTEAANKKWIDALELQVEERNRAGRRIMRGYDDCRGQAAPAS
ncbi:MULTISPECIES: hypothetical protein [Rhodomicrobium]|nr:MULTISPECIES: hypothetical protein [Rhodomicrobium]